MQWDTVILGMIAASGAVLGGWATIQRNRADTAREVRIEARDGMQALNTFLEKELALCRADSARKDALLDHWRDVALVGASALERAAAQQEAAGTVGGAGSGTGAA